MTPIDQLMQSAVALLGAGRVEEALRLLDDIAVRRPDWAGAHNNRGAALIRLNRLDDAAESFRRAIAIDPGHVDAMCNLAHVLAACGRLSETVVVCHSALMIRRDYPRARLNLANAYMRLGRVSQAIDECRQVLRVNPDHLQAHSVMLYCMLFHPETSAADLFDEHRRWAGRHADPFTPAEVQFEQDRDPDRRLRVGYVSGDFHEHPVGRAVRPLFLNHDSRQCEIIAFSDDERPDELTATLRSLAAEWHSTAAMSSDALAGFIRGCRIDVLIDLTLHMVGDRLRVFAHRPAPVQVSFIGYAFSTGIVAMDYRLTDSHLDPPGLTEAFNTETLYRLPRSFYCYLPDGGEPEPSPVRPDRPFTFGSLNNPAKVSLPAIATWCDILHATPGSKLQMVVPEEGPEAYFTGEFARRGIAADRLVLVRPRPRRDYLALYNEIDVALDPFPYAGGVTTCDALWMGVPVVTLAGSTSVGRAGASILSSAGAPELIAADASTYTRLATELAGNPDRVAGYHAALREQVRRSPVGDAAGFAHDVETAYRTMWRNWCSGKGR